MLTLTRQAVVRSMSPSHPPAAIASPGEKIRFLTMDCTGDQFVDENNIFFDEQFAGNPATGPLFVKNAMPGDTLKVEILTINMPSRAMMATIPGFGVFGDEITEIKRNIYNLEKGQIVFDDKLNLDLKPMIGVIGVAPQSGEVTNSYPGEHGGNMDCKMITEGSIVYLPVFIEGAMLSIGDVHALMGDGEVCICGAEVQAEVIIRIDVLKYVLESVVVISEGKIMTICSDTSLEKAGFAATKAMRRLVARTIGLEFHASCRLLSLAGNLCICQVVDPLMTCRMELPLEVFAAYGYRFG